MAYRAQRDTARDRVRAVTGDTSDPPLLAGGEAAYDAIIAAATTEHAAAVRACRELRAQLSKDPSRLSSAGDSLAWEARDRYLEDVVTGRVGTGLSGDPRASVTAAPYAVTSTTSTFTRDMD